MFNPFCCNLTVDAVLSSNELHFCNYGNVMLANLWNQAWWGALPPPDMTHQMLFQMPSSHLHHIFVTYTCQLTRIETTASSCDQETCHQVIAVKSVRV